MKSLRITGLDLAILAYCNKFFDAMERTWKQCGCVEGKTLRRLVGANDIGGLTLKTGNIENVGSYEYAKFNIFGIFLSRTKFTLTGQMRRLVSGVSSRWFAEGEWVLECSVLRVVRDDILHL